jgi:hypothetical protein
MAKYKVIALSVHSEKTQSIMKSNDIVDADAFPEGHAEKLVEQGFLEPYNGEEAAPEVEAPAEAEVSNDIVDADAPAAEETEAPAAGGKSNRNKK